jgi:hypothetical protein
LTHFEETDDPTTRSVTSFDGDFVDREMIGEIVVRSVE